MAKQGQGGLEDITGALARAGVKGPPPVERWNPPFCGDLDMRIAADGTWFYMKTPIGRPALVKLFASVLKREGDKYYLVTPVEKCGIVVEDAPFLAVELRIDTQASRRILHFRTNVDDWVACGPEHALRFEPEPETGGLKPYLHVRRDLMDRAGRIGLDGTGRPSLTSNADRMRLVPRVLPRDPGACGHPDPARLEGLVLIASKSKRPDGVLVPFREIDDDLVRPGNDAATLECLHDRRGRRQRTLGRR
jgi:hypothetical protein